MTATMKTLKMALDYDPSLTARYFEVLDAMTAANDENAALEDAAMMEDFRHCRLPGE